MYTSAGVALELHGALINLPFRSLIRRLYAPRSAFRHLRGYIYVCVFQIKLAYPTSKVHVRIFYFHIQGLLVEFVVNSFPEVYIA